MQTLMVMETLHVMSCTPMCMSKLKKKNLNRQTPTRTSLEVKGDMIIAYNINPIPKKITLTFPDDMRKMIFQRCLMLSNLAVKIKNQIQDIFSIWNKNKGTMATPHVRILGRFRENPGIRQVLGLLADKTLVKTDLDLINEEVKFLEEFIDKYPVEARDLLLKIKEERASLDRLLINSLPLSMGITLYDKGI